MSLPDQNHFVFHCMENLSWRALATLAGAPAAVFVRTGAL
jgi:hypothetical protein